MSQPWEVLDTKCMNCGRALKVPAARRRRAIRLGHSTADFCSRSCSTTYISRVGRMAQEQLAKSKIKP